jgi:hypothetical protein
MALGISFGSNKSKTNETKTTDQTQTSNQTKAGTTTSSGTTTGSSNTSGSSQTSGTQQNQQQGSTTQTGTQTGSQTGVTNLFGADVLSGLEGAVGGLIQGIFGAGGTGGAVDASALGQFDPAAFVQGGLASAQAATQGTLESNINQLTSGIGGTAGSNSMAALLANRLRSDSAASLAGVEADLNARAQETVRQNVLAQQQVQSAQNDFLGNLLAGLKGGTQTTTGTQTQANTQTGSSASTGTTTSAEQTAQQQSTQTQQTQQLIEQLQELLSGVQSLTGTETLAGTTKKSGGGLSLSL